MRTFFETSGVIPKMGFLIKKSNTVLKQLSPLEDFMFIKIRLWSNVKVDDELKVEVESNLKSIAHNLYSCAIKAKHQYFTGWKTVGHIPREIS